MKRFLKRIAKRSVQRLGSAMGLDELVEIHNLCVNLQYHIDGAPDGFPIPPSHLRFLISHQEDYPVRTFLDHGRGAVSFYVEVLTKVGVSLDELHAVLDFGCGCGRNIRHFASLNKPNLKLHGTDYNPKLVDWCKQNLPFADFAVNQLSPPLTYRDGQFDFIYADSVFTHLTEPLQFQWIDELSRVVKPGGHIFISTHGECYLQGLTDGEKEQFRAGQIITKSDDQVGSNYCASFQSPKHVQEKLARGLKILFSDIGHGQDLYLLQRPPAIGNVT